MSDDDKSKKTTRGHDWNHSTLEWIHNGSNRRPCEETYVVANVRRQNNGTPVVRPSDTNTRLSRIDRALSKLAKGHTTSKGVKQDKFYLSVLAQDFTKRGWTVKELKEDIELLITVLENSKNKDLVKKAKKHKEILTDERKSWTPSSNRSNSGMSDDKLLEQLINNLTL